jgi:hypothetical protein
MPRSLTDRGRLAVAVVGLGLLAGASSGRAAMPCASEDEAHGFVLRHLQSRLMVAALSCNQREAYNSFAQRFLGDLAAGGRALAAYFQRTGLGTPALNKHVTELANAAGLDRAADPGGFCEATWQLFWDLEQAPEKLSDIAAAHMVPAVRPPQSCAAVASAPLPRKTAAPQEAKAAVKN